MDCEPLADVEAACCAEAACAEAPCDAVDGGAALRIAVVLPDADPCDVLVVCFVGCCSGLDEEGARGVPRRADFPSPGADVALCFVAAAALDFESDVDAVRPVALSFPACPLTGCPDDFVRETGASDDGFPSLPVADAVDSADALPFARPAVSGEDLTAAPAVACDEVPAALPDVLVGFGSALARDVAGLAFVGSVDVPWAASLAVPFRPEGVFAACPSLDLFAPDSLAADRAGFDASSFEASSFDASDEADAVCELVVLWDDSDEPVDDDASDPVDGAVGRSFCCEDNMAPKAVPSAVLCSDDVSSRGAGAGAEDDGMAGGCIGGQPVQWADDNGGSVARAQGLCYWRTTIRSTSWAALSGGMACSRRVRLRPVVCA